VLFRSVLGSLRSNVDDPLHVGHGQYVMHELCGLQERRKRDVVERPHHHRPYRSTNQRSEDEAARSHQNPIEDDRGGNGGDRPNEVDRIALGDMPLEISAEP
jgi:hypothetical protein